MAMVSAVAHDGRCCPCGVAAASLGAAPLPLSAPTSASTLRCNLPAFGSRPPRGVHAVLPRHRRRTGRTGSAFASIRDAEELVRSGVVRPVPAKDVAGLLRDEGYLLLDVRPVWERARAHVAGSYHVPLFVEDVDAGALTLLKKGIQAGQGGWWLGQKLTARNEQFVEQVKATLPVGQKLVIACGEGLRSLLALEELNDAGFQQMAWMAGGFVRARDEDFLNVEGVTELRFATIGGASVYMLKLALFMQGLSARVKRRLNSADSI